MTDAAAGPSDKGPSSGSVSSDKRGPLRTGVTKVCRNIDDAIRQGSPDPFELQSFLDVLEDKAHRLYTLDEGILASLEADERAYLAESEKVEEYRDKITRGRSLAKRKLEELRSVPPPSSPSASNRSDNGDASHNSSQPQSTQAGVLQPALMQQGLKMPDWKLGTFSGESYLDFPSWWDNFLAMVDANPVLSDVQRFGILKESLSGSARQLIGSLLLTAENYKKARDLLHQTYGDPSVLLGLFVQKLHSQTAVQDARSPQFSRLVYSFEQIHIEIRNLISKIQRKPSDAAGACSPPSSEDESTGVDITSFFLTPLILGKLPQEVQLQWMQKNQEPGSRYDFHALMEYLKSDIKSRDICSMMNQEKRAHGPAQGSASGEDRPRGAMTSLFSNAQATGCVVCKTGDRHPIFRCSVFQHLLPPERKNAARQARCCFNCLSFSHMNRNCPSKGVCRRCSSRHHTMLCDRKDASPGNASRGDTENSPATDENTNAVSLVASSLIVSPKERQKVFLPIAKIKVSNPAERVSREVFCLFDSGSTHSWISQSLAKAVKLPVIQRNEFSLQTFGGTKANQVSSQVRCLVSDVHDPTTATEFTPWTADKLAKRIALPELVPVPEHLKQLELDCYTGEVSIDLLIGADHYQDFMTGEAIKGSPTAVRTLFGYVLHGAAARGPPASEQRTSFFTYVDSVKGRGKFTKCFSSSEKAEYREAIRKLEDDRIIARGEPDLWGQEENDKKSKGGFFLPHHALRKEGKPFRLVFDGSTRDFQGIALRKSEDTISNAKNRPDPWWARPEWRKGRSHLSSSCHSKGMTRDLPAGQAAAEPSRAKRKGSTGAGESRPTGMSTGAIRFGSSDDLISGKFRPQARSASVGIQK